MMNNLRISFPDNTPIRERLRLAWTIFRFIAWYNRRTPAEQERIMTYLSSQPGVTVRECP